MIRKSLLVIFSFALCILAGEVFFELTAPEGEFPAQDRCRKRHARERGQTFDLRSRAALIAELRAKGVRAYPSPYYGLYRWPSFREALERQKLDLTPLSGPGGVSSVLINEGGFHPIYVSDRHGFNNPDEAWDEQVDVLVIGDSYVHGQGVRPGDDIAGQLRKLGWKTLNLGISDHGPAGELAILREYGARVKSRHVIWAYYSNDLRDLGRDRADPRLSRYVEDADFSQGLFDRQEEMDALLRPYLNGLFEDQLAEEKNLVPPGWVETASSILSLNRLRSRSQMVLGEDKTKRTFDEEMELLRRVLGAARNSVSAWGGRLHFLHIPDYGDYESTDPDAGYRRWLVHRERTQGPLRKEGQRVMESARALDIPVVDFNDFLSKESDAHEYFNLGCPGHFSASGYQAMARQLDGELRQSVLR